MNEQEALNHKVDRSGWPSGEWDTEPDRVDFEHAGFACMLIRNRLGAWCGYVGVGPEHPMHGKDYNQPDVDVHGGLTYADKCSGNICHVPKLGMPADVWWFGFDCVHSGDVAPGMMMTNLRMGWAAQGWDEQYRSVHYAQSHTESLAEQLGSAK